MSDEFQFLPHGRASLCVPSWKFQLRHQQAHLQRWVHSRKGRSHQVRNTYISIFYFLQLQGDLSERLPVIRVRISDISTDFIQVHLGLRHQHLPAAGGGHELHRPQHELQRGRLPAGALQVCSVAIPRPLYCLVFIFRKASFYIVTYYLPSGLFVVVSWISFLINPEVSHSHSLTTPSVPARTSQNFPTKICICAKIEMQKTCFWSWVF